MWHKYEETGNGECRLFAVPTEPEDKNKLMFMEGSLEECVARYRKIREVAPPGLEGMTLIVCNETGFPVCAA